MFVKARPIFLKDLQYEMNITGVFVCIFEAQNICARLRVAGSTRYKVWFNGELLTAGPARAAHGYSYVDELALDLKKGGTLRIDLASYYCRCYDGVKHAGFVIAEVTAGDKVIAATGYNFKAFRNVSRLQKVMRFTGQRHFSEVYRGVDELEEYPWEFVAEDMKYIPREAPEPCMDIIEVLTVGGTGTFSVHGEYRRDPWYIRRIPEFIEGFDNNALAAAPYREYRRLGFIPDDAAPHPFEEAEIGAGRYVMCDLGQVHTGFIQAEVEAEEGTELIISYEDYCPEPFVGTERMFNQCIHVISYTLKAGAWKLENFDPIELRYMQFTVLKGKIRLKQAGMRQFIYPEVKNSRLNSGDAVLDEIYDAAVSTFRQNSLDIYMDCPGRERGGWLCDSYYTAQTEYALTGDNRLERVFLKNFLLAGQRPDLPEGMLPQCYPADTNGGFIPQWAMWYVLELEEALERSGMTNRADYKELCYGLVRFFAKYLNSDGLLERLPGWNFIEWSKCNDWKWDVNYPTNFLYSRFLKAVGTMYEDAELLAQCQSVRQETIKRSFDGRLFTDNAIRNEQDVLQNTGNTSETCQYYAIHFGEIDLDAPQYAYLKHAFEAVFGTDRTKYAQLGREVEPSNAFMGIYLRLECLMDRGMYQDVLKEIKEYFGGMASLTGTLWEHKTVENGSLNHGFASYVAAVLRKAFCRK